MKHHKFMAFDKVKGEWVWPYPGGFGIIGEITVHDVLAKYNSNNYENLEIVQYTGLNDRNDNEIYDGHIVKCRPVPDIILICVVKFIEGVYEVHGNSGFYNRLNIFTTARIIEIIGHRLTHPELMDKINKVVP